MRCGGCGLHCVGMLYGCQLCAHFCLCGVCFAAHVRISAMSVNAEDDQGQKQEKEGEGDETEIPPSDLGGTGDGGSGGGGEVQEAVDEQEEHERDDDACADYDDMFQVNEDDDADGGDDVVAGDNRVLVFTGVHVHPPLAFLRQGDSDQQLMEEMAAEKAARMAANAAAAAALAAAATAATARNTAAGATVGAAAAAATPVRLRDSSEGERGTFGSAAGSVAFVSGGLVSPMRATSAPSASGEFGVGETVELTASRGNAIDSTVLVPAAPVPAVRGSAPTGAVAEELAKKKKRDISTWDYRAEIL